MFVLMQINKMARFNQIKESSLKLKHAFYQTFFWISLLSGTVFGKCETPIKAMLPGVSKEETYKEMPFQPGEISKYAVYYAGIKAGYGNLKVLPPEEFNGKWQRVFAGEASTGDWYNAIFVVKDYAKAYSRPQDFAINKFRLTQDEGKLIGSKFHLDKWLDFDQQDCIVHETVKKLDGTLKFNDFPLENSAADALGVVFRMRTLKYKVGEVEKALVYSSEKNWWLEAIPMDFEDVEVPAGKFKTVKIKLHTYIGKELQQRGDVHVWLATEHPNHPVIMITGDVKIGSLSINLETFTPGKPLEEVTHPNEIRPTEQAHPIEEPRAKQPSP